MPVIQPMMNGNRVASLNRVEQISLVEGLFIVLIAADPARSQLVLDPVPGLRGVVAGSVAWGGYDNDSKLDLLIAGLTNFSGGAVSQLWRNSGRGFTRQPITSSRSIATCLEVSLGIAARTFLSLCAINLHRFMPTPRNYVHFRNGFTRARVVKPPGSFRWRITDLRLRL